MLGGLALRQQTQRKAGSCKSKEDCFCMSGKVDLYNSAYGNYGAEVYRQIRVETYGEDLGQTSWATTEESREIPRTLGLRGDSQVLEIGCGSGRYALQVAESVGCRMVGIDTNGPGIRTANELVKTLGMASQVCFDIGDASNKLPFDDSSFDAAFSNDVFCHVPGRVSLLREVHRVLKRGGRMLFSDALVIGGMISHEEIAIRSSIGYYFFSPPGENERLIEKAGLRLLGVMDTSEDAARIAERWCEARQKRKEALIAIEGADNFEGLQRFLSTVQTLTSERRLLRNVYVAQKPLEIGGRVETKRRFGLTMRSADRRLLGTLEGR
jgi:SAM-dependent methyltransferase